ncbi:LysR family transcriptional regulator [Nocardioides albus]|uniref:DNA-binding transcriptional LysR family regulator n=1 Tax=Nocardioides albus TaxID=1841 RepID=A0A7W5A8I6_9ACTN|nr:DNA-binding transcriptional LysR family regulator [Nocardioides albus]
MDLLLHLRGFAAVADEMSVSEAALELGVDQPLLSRRLRALERELGVELLDRSRRQIALTPAGHALLPRARHLLDQADHLLRSIRRHDRERFVLAVPSGCAPAPLGRLVALLEAEGVDIRLTSDDEETPQSAAWLVDACDPDAATWITPLGVATPPAAPEASQRPVSLGSLRPRRRGERTQLLALPRDLDDPAGRLRRLADRAGIGPAALRRTPHRLAVAETLAGRATMVCARHEAVTYGLSWSPFVDPVSRGHRLIELQPLPAKLAAGPVREQSLALLGACVGVPEEGSA